MRKLLNKVMGITPQGPYCGCTYIHVASCIPGCGNLRKTIVYYYDCETRDLCGTDSFCGC